MKILFLDNDSTRVTEFLKCHPQADIVYTARECIQALKTKRYDVVSLDHDLGDLIWTDPGHEIWINSGRENTGMEVVKHLQDKKSEVGYIIVHSWNPAASLTMVERLRDAGYHVAYRPFSLD